MVDKLKLGITLVCIKPHLINGYVEGNFYKITDEKHSEKFSVYNIGNRHGYIWFHDNPEYPYAGKGNYIFDYFIILAEYREERINDILFG